MTATIFFTRSKTGASALAAALLLSLNASMVHAAPRRTPAKKAPAATTSKAPAAAAAQTQQAAQAQQNQVADYVAAVVNSVPVTNHEVNKRAREIAQQAAANQNSGQNEQPQAKNQSKQAKQQPKPQAEPQAVNEALLKQALDELIVQKAAIQSVRNTTLTVSEDEFNDAERKLASQRNVSPKDFRARVMAERRISEAEYRKDLTDQLLLRKMREARVDMAREKITDIEAMQWLREHKGSDARITENHARHILLLNDKGISEQQAAAKLADIRKQIVAGKLDFAMAARTTSQDGSAEHGGDLGWAPEGAFVPEFEEHLASMQPGQISQPFASRFGVHLVQLLERRSKPMPQAQQVQIARSILAEEKAAETLAQWENEVRAQAYIEMREAAR